MPIVYNALLSDRQTSACTVCRICVPPWWRAKLRDGDKKCRFVFRPKTRNRTTTVRPGLRPKTCAPPPSIHTPLLFARLALAISSKGAVGMGRAVTRAGPQMCMPKLERRQILTWVFASKLISVVGVGRPTKCNFP